MTLNVHHYYPLGSENIGDGLVARAIRQAFVHHFGPAHFVDMPANDCYRGTDRPIGLCGLNIDRTNAEADLVIVGGSNMLEPRKPRCSEKSNTARRTWGVFTDLESIGRLAPPILLAGMGTGSSFGKRIRNYQPVAREEIRLLHARALASSVRDQTTANRLAQIGVATLCTGCPVTFWTDRPVMPGPDRLPLLVSLPPARILQRFMGISFMRSAMRYVDWLRRTGVPLIVTLHEPKDKEAARQWLPSGIEVFGSTDLDEWIDRFESSRGVIGFRLHAALLGLGLGKPVVPVGVDWRGLAFIETFQFQDISMRPFRFGQFAKLRALTKLLLEGDGDFIARLNWAKVTYLARYESFFRESALRFRSLVPAG